MPKRRPSGPQRGSRRHREGAPHRNFPAANPPSGAQSGLPPGPDAETLAEGAALDQTDTGGQESRAIPVPTGRRVRPTLRMATGQRHQRGGLPPPDIQVDYSYVSADLRQLAILGAGGFAILIALSFVIQ